MEQHYFLQLSQPADVSPIFLDGIELRCNFTLASFNLVSGNAITVELTSGAVHVRISRTLLIIRSLSERQTAKTLVGAAMKHITDAIESREAILGAEIRLTLDSLFTLEGHHFESGLPDEFVDVWLPVKGWRSSACRSMPSSARQKLNT